MTCRTFWKGLNHEWINFCIAGSIPARQLAELAGCCSESVAACSWAKSKHMCTPEHVRHTAISCIQGKLLVLVLKTVSICMRYMNRRAVPRLPNKSPWCDA
jgi:hypothetical protein